MSNPETCISCGKEIPPYRIRRGAKTCSSKCYKVQNPVIPNQIR